MLLSLCLIIGFIVSSRALEPIFYDVQQAEKLFEDFITTHGKIYPTEQEKQMRREVFKNRLHILNEMNSIGGAVFAINQFSDLTKEEIKQRSCLKYSLLRDLPDDCKILTDKDINTNKAPSTLDWVAKGAVNVPENQGGCSSCYAFSTIGNIEGQYFIKTNQLKTFSKQEIVDCSKENYGCNGGFMATAMTDLKNLGGVELESEYPYKDKEQQCQFNSSNVVVKVVGCTKYQLTDENKLKEVVATRGPISFGLSGAGLTHYRGGILSRAHCSNDTLDHAVLLVGYGTSSDGIDFWLVKNSSGPKWGESGYLRMTRGENTCGLMNSNGHIASAEL